jgi:hypothetical protein
MVVNTLSALTNAEVSHEICNPGDLSTHAPKKLLAIILVSLCSEGFLRSSFRDAGSSISKACREVELRYELRFGLPKTSFSVA